jgi:hypothetical protein
MNGILGIPFISLAPFVGVAIREVCEICQYDSRDYFCHFVHSFPLIYIQSLGIFVTQTANNFPELLYTLIFQIEYKILLHNSNVDMDDVLSK